MSIYHCSVCKHVSLTGAPDKCPVCFSGKESFAKNDSIFTDSAEKSKEAAVKHIPVIKINKQCGLIPENSCVDVHARIGSVLHPMEEKHFINHIDFYIDDQFVSRMQLTPAANPSACLHLKKSGSKVTVVEFCNLHGYWKEESAL